jgi:hypothetical protein
VLAYSLWVQYIVGSVPARVKSKTIKLVYISSLLREKTKYWLKRYHENVSMSGNMSVYLVDGRSSEFDL